MKIDLDIDKQIPPEVVAIIRRAEIDIHAPALFNADQLSHIISQMIQQAYYFGCLDGNSRAHKAYADTLKNLGKAVQS